MANQGNLPTGTLQKIQSMQQIVMDREKQGRQMQGGPMMDGNQQQPMQQGGPQPGMSNIGGAGQPMAGFQNSQMGMGQQGQMMNMPHMAPPTAQEIQMVRQRMPQAAPLPWFKK